MGKSPKQGSGGGGLGTLGGKGGLSAGSVDPIGTKARLASKDPGILAATPASAQGGGGMGRGIGRNELAGILAERDRGNMFNARNGTGGDRGFGRSPQADWQRMMYAAADYGMDPRTGQVMYPGRSMGMPAPPPGGGSR